MKCYPCTAGAHLLRVVHASPWTTIPRGDVSGMVGSIPDSKVHGTNMGPNWGRQDPGGAPCWPRELCHLRYFTGSYLYMSSAHISLKRTIFLNSYHIIGILLKV